MGGINKYNNCYGKKEITLTTKQLLDQKKRERRDVKEKIKKYQSELKYLELEIKNLEKEIEENKVIDTDIKYLKLELTRQESRITNLEDKKFYLSESIDKLSVKTTVISFLLAWVIIYLAFIIK